jgi:hypothetical protein
MALGGVFMTDTDGNIGKDISNLTEKVCGLVFDISAQTDIWTKGAGVKLAAALKDTVVELNSIEDADTLGLAAYTGEKDEDTNSKDFLAGIPYYHIKHFFTACNNSGRLFIAFADCLSNWNALVDMQKAAHGTINQFGVWTEQRLWKQTDASAETYSIQIVSDLQSTAKQLADSYNAPCVVLLNANTSKVATASGDATKVVFSKIPTCIVDARYVSVLLGQGLDTDVTKMQCALESTTPVGNVGAALGELTKCNVGECMGWVRSHDLIGYFPDIEFGFGDSEVENNALKNSTKYSSLSQQQLDTLDNLGYVFLMRYTGLEGHVYFSGDKTCSDGDYCTIARNRTINKSRRSVRTALLPYVNSPIKVNRSNGQLSAAQITVFTNLISDILTAMTDAEEISGMGKITIPATQNILKNDKLVIQYTIVPLGCAKTIEVTEGLVLSVS